MNGQPTIQDLVGLIESLYSERDPKKISSIQNYLQNIQKSPTGLELADILLFDTSYSLKCKFFGALTYTINLNSFKSDHSKIKINNVLFKLLQNTTNLINDYRFNRIGNLFVIKKLFQNLSIIFNSYLVQNKQWNNPLAAIIQILITNQAPNELSTDIVPEEVINDLFSDVKAVQLALQMSSIIVEDLLKIGKDQKDVVIHEKVSLYTYTTTKNLIIKSFQFTSDELKVSSLECLNSWIQYISFAENVTHVRYRDLSDILQYLFGYLETTPTDSELFQLVISSLTDILENNASLLSVELRNKFNELISNDWTLQRINDFFQLEDFDLMERFVILIIDFLEIDQLKFVASVFRNENSKLLSFLLNLTNLPLLPVVQENVSKKFIEFWSQISEIFVDEHDSITVTLKEDATLIDKIKTNSQITFGEITKIYYDKISYKILTNSEFNANKNEFASYRDDVTELFDSIYSNIGTALYQNLARNVSNNQDLNQIESSLYLISSLSHAFSEDHAPEDILSAIHEIFESQFLSNISNLVSQIGNYAQYYMKTVIHFLGTIGFYYKLKGGSYLTLSIDYLFNCLKNYPEQQVVISKTILQICDDCRSQLASSIDNFTPILMELVNDSTVSPNTRERFLNSIGCIIQSIPDPNTQVQHAIHIICLIETAANPYLVKASNNTINSNELEYIISLFTSVYQLGKGLQIPDTYHEENEPVFNNIKKFYLEYYDGKVQTKLIKLINAFTIEIDLLSKNNEIGEKASLIYKIGLLEDYGVFSLSSQSIVEYVFLKAQKNLTVNSLTYLLELLITFFNVGLKKLSLQHQQISEEQVSSIIKSFIIDQFNLIKEDPDLLQLTMSLFSALVNNRCGFFVRDTQTFQFIVKIALELISSKEKLIIKAVSKFWTGLISAKAIQADELLILKQFIENDIGEILTYSVFKNLIDASRSDVESYGNIIVLLLSKHQLKFQNWARATLDKLDQERQQSGLKGIPDKEIFLKKVLLTRGSIRKCNDIIKEFWITVNGLISYNK